ncbi:hypothetical protein, partial [Flavobacterium sp. ACAM 123]|uniref:hypothetical protein n=1 Tax=Flavobacterium sp. ACAM 123 TaxID=1189620 RepID=UPI0005561777
EFDNGQRFCKTLLASGYTKEAFFYWLKILKLRPTSEVHQYFFRMFKKRLLHKLGLLNTNKN